MMADLARAPAEHRIPGRHATNGRGIAGEGPNTKSRLLRQLARDYPKILEAYERGEFPSVRAAAREAGIVKDAKPFDQIRKLLEKHASSLTPSERRALEDML
jgi:hypothetical protein